MVVAYFFGPPCIFSDLVMRGRYASVDYNAVVFQPGPQNLRVPGAPARVSAFG